MTGLQNVLTNCRHIVYTALDRVYIMPNDTTLRTYVRDNRK
jgi:hypothetical protein